MLYWTRRELKKFFSDDFGWLLLIAIAVFALRSSTLWHSRGKDVAPAINRVLETAAYLLAVPFLIVFCIFIASCLYKSFKNYRLRVWSKNKTIAILRESEAADTLRASLTYVLAIYIVSGLLIAWGFNLPIFGGVLGAILTLIQIVAAVLALIGKSK